ncbi:MAG: hypothetical protein AB8B61_01630 [Cyclobacteriaceae bacterium]
MTESSTNDPYLDYLFNDNSVSEQEMVEQELLLDQKKAKDIAAYKEILEETAKITFSPSQKSVDTIIAYAKSANLHALN